MPVTLSVTVSNTKPWVLRPLTVALKPSRSRVAEPPPLTLMRIRLPKPGPLGRAVVLPNFRVMEWALREPSMMVLPV